MTLNESILTARSIGIEEMALLICMAQNCDATGALPGITSDKDLMRAFNAQYGKRTSVDKIKEWIDSLLEKECIPSRHSVYPPSKMSSPEEVKELLRRIVQLRESTASRIPRNPKQKGHERIAHALHMIQMEEAGYKPRREDIETPDGKPLYIEHEGVRIRSSEYAWDFGYVGRWIRAHGEDHVLDVLCDLQKSRAWENVTGGTSFSQRQKAFRGYIEGALKQKGSGSLHDAYSPPTSSEDVWIN
jgi:hypothetical protein